MTKKKETNLTINPDSPESLEATDIAHKALNVVNAAIAGTAADEAWDIPTDPAQARIALSKYKAVVAALNAANGIVKTKMQLFKLMGLAAKVKKLKARGKKL